MNKPCLLLRHWSGGKRNIVNSVLQWTRSSVAASLFCIVEINEHLPNENTQSQFLQFIIAWESASITWDLKETQKHPGECESFTVKMRKAVSMLQLEPAVWGNRR
jgi:hypothetical protein